MFVPGGAARRARGSDERGETLIELLATVFLLGIVIVGLMTALLNVIISSDNNRRHARAGNVAATMGELIKAATYQPCAAAGAPTAQTNFYKSAAASALPNADFSYTVLVEPLVSRTAAATPANPAKFQANCPATDQGAQRVTVTVTSTGRSTAVEAVVLIIRKKT